jgi:AcrR family transcriptional regulator
MQAVAGEAGMSPGNLYRYFPSKDALVAGIAERDRHQLMAEFVAIGEAEDLMAAFAKLGRKHFTEDPREKIMLCLEIWAEATRNEAVATASVAFERLVVGQISDLLRTAVARGQLPATTDPEGIAILIATLANGLFVRRAIVGSFDAEREVRNVLAVIGALLEGSVDLNRGDRADAPCGETVA